MSELSQSQGIKNRENNNGGVNGIEIRDILETVDEIYQYPNINESLIDVDIIIPVYNAFEHFCRCLYSVLIHTDCSYRLILINDGSTDPGINCLFDELWQRETNFITVLDNEDNQGYTHTVNKGISFSDKDVILLNADTVVTAGWLKKIKDCAYSNKMIATVSPLTNNGQHCSILFHGSRKIPHRFTIDTLAELIEKVSLRRYPKIPFSPGFCMYIKRQVIDEIGLFDEETFGRGYYEEYDFCFRASAKGYYHVMDDATYIYHEGSCSFNKEKESLAEANFLRLKMKYPDCVKEINRIFKENPQKDIRLNILEAVRSPKKYLRKNFNI